MFASDARVGRQDGARSSRPHARMHATARVLVVGAALAAAGACSNGTGSSIHLRYGDAVAVGAGTARTWVATTGSGSAPDSIGVAFTEQALTNLPSAQPGTAYMLTFPAGVSSGAFDHVMINWNPTGHPPSGVYDVPHFDVHFYMIGTGAQDSITPADSNGEATPAAQDIPTDYMEIPGVVPQMGVHWADSTAPELHGTPFTSTFIYGFYDARMIFVEPMVTLAFLQARTTTSAALKLPAHYPTAGDYPTTYSVSYDAAAKEHRITLGAFAHRS